MKKIKIIIIIALIINLIILFLLLYISHTNKKNMSNYDYTGRGITGTEASFELNNKIYPIGYTEFKRSFKDSKFDCNLVYQSISELKNFISSKKYEEYKYNQNKNDINSKIHILNEQDYIKLCEISSKNKLGDISYKNVKITRNSGNLENSSYWVVNIEYPNNINIYLKLVILDYNLTKFKFIPIVEE